MKTSDHGTARRTRSALAPALAAAIAAALAAAWVAPAAAHATLEHEEAVAGSYYKAVVRVSHGCKGEPTVQVRVRVPAGSLSVRPQPKPGWTLDITRTKLAQPVDAGHGRVVTEAVSEVRWSGGRLPDEHFDEFVLLLRLPDRPGTTVHFPVVQECSKGVHRWIELPDPQRPDAKLAEPAPALRLLPRP
jgi:uncharacterized protein YcnI